MFSLRQANFILRAVNMISGDHAVIRSTESDDVQRVKKLYDPRRPFAFLLDKYDELTAFNTDEVTQLLTKKKSVLGRFYAVEDKTGIVRGFCALRGASQEVGYAEIAIMLFESGDYKSELADEAFEFLVDLAFVHQRLNKVLARCLDIETSWRDFLLRKKFESNGRQRELVFTMGAWHDLETLSLLCNNDMIQGG